MTEKKLSKWSNILFLLLTATLLAIPVSAETVRVPIKLDYPVLRQLMHSQLFNTADKSVEILNDATGCSSIFLSDPQLREHQHKLEVTTHVKANIATATFGNCTPLFNWEGEAKFLTEPVIQTGARSVMLRILSTRLYNPQGKLITGPIWELASGQLLSFMNRYEIDLSPAINQLNRLLPDILDKRSAAQISKISDSLKLAEITIQPDGITVAADLQVERLPATPDPAEIFTLEEIQQLEENWQMMDAMITFAVKHYANATHQQELRDTLVEVLLDARYRLVDALTMQVTRADDPVRHWFIDSWQQLGPVLRQISQEKPGQEPMLLISLLAATDALATLDRLGPSIGLDISANGLRNMGRMLIDQPGIDPLLYEDTVDPELRLLFRLPPSLELSEPSGYNFNLWPISSAWAASPEDRLKLWVPTKSELPVYLPLIRDLLEDSSKSATSIPRLEPATKKIFADLVLTTAWQESCWRQYMLKNKKVVSLHSSTGDTGLMQINERVWRGLYDVQKLRWDITYNAQAGTEVLLNYLLKYALKRDEHKRQGGLDNLARSTYSAYNGGPGKTSRYRDAKTPSSLKKVDAAFWKKYQAVKQGNEFQVATCLGAEAADIVASPANKQLQKNVSVQSAKQPSPTTNNASDKAWVLAQDKNHYTLQLAVFSSLKAAQQFIAESRLKGAVAVVPLGKDKRGQFVVLNGSFKEKAAADKFKQQYKNLKPWVRQIKEIDLSTK
ncbi:SPOR domain-containing protein [Psychromonas sp.]|uniref:SPOR domain-containing protein n=1 Tax=Psychromonas sp. TaxID=1884585 RepID=UPI0035613F57